MKKRLITISLALLLVFAFTTTSMAYDCNLDGGHALALVNTEITEEWERHCVSYNETGCIKTYQNLILTYECYYCDYSDQGPGQRINHSVNHYQ